MTSFQSSELTELPVVENSQLFAQRTVRPLLDIFAKSTAILIFLGPGSSAHLLYDVWSIIGETSLDSAHGTNIVQPC